MFHLAYYIYCPNYKTELYSKQALFILTSAIKRSIRKLVLFKIIMNMKGLCIVSGVILIAGIIPTWPYSYYILLRWAIFFSAIIAVYGFYNSKLFGWSLVFGAIAFLFNPIIPIYLTRQIWAPIDLVTGSLYFIAGFLTKKNKK